MPVLIREIVSEIVIGDASATPSGPRSDAGEQLDEQQLERIVRRATERVLEHLRREWEI